VLWLILRCFDSVLCGSWLTALDSIVLATLFVLIKFKLYSSYVYCLFTSS